MVLRLLSAATTAARPSRIRPGTDALRELRARPDTEPIPVIALTAAASEDDNERGLQAGFNHDVAKPVKVDDLLRALAGMLTPLR